MKGLEAVRLALRALTTNKLRSALTMLGIVIGVGAVITLMSVGEGVQAYITGQFESIGTNLFFVIPGSFDEELDRPAYLTLKDVEALRDPAEAPDVLYVSPLIQGNAAITTPGKEKQIEVSGVTPVYSLVRDWGTTVGAFISEADEASRGRVAVLGLDTANYFFPNTPNPVGEVIRINGAPFRVIGVLEEKSSGDFQNENETVLIPLSTTLSRIFPRRTNRGEPRVNFIYVQAKSDDRMEAAMAEVSQVLRQRHRILPGQPDDFTIVSQDDLIGTFQQITSVLTVFLGAIAGISLLVGGIGIMNIMLVSVTERTREIGLRKAVGARRRDVLMQFLIEAMMLSMFGGGLGILLGGSGATAVSYFLRDQGFSAVITPSAVALATLFSAAVGLFFGIYPAQRAAGLNPIDALRYE